MNITLRVGVLCTSEVVLVNVLNRDGYRVEERIRKFLGGRKSDLDWVDFETKNACFEVKSCHLFVATPNGPTKDRHKLNKKYSYQQGRFVITNGNHFDLKRHADERFKEAKYVFVLKVGKQLCWRVVDWRDVKVQPRKDLSKVLLSAVFGAYCSKKGDGS